MAKVRIQARSADVEDAAERHEELPHTHEYHHRHGHHVGALDILARVWKKEGFTGWYQVRGSFVCTLFHKLTPLYREWKRRLRRQSSRRRCSSCQKSNSSIGPSPS